ncbi:hypothetical protein Bca4012_018611 [Brassica carinata]|uniref:Uncharacterized protein n=1 Tax=Brassica carinata TaxID=52824 RepID=A0A8X7WMZ7_BRACI|nr:hypothetical protein Bca52824_002920 [Brassica carinata]
MLAISSSSTTSVTDPNSMVVLPLPFPMPTTQQPLDPPDLPGPQVPPSKHDFSIILWKVSTAAQPHSTNLELDSGDPISLQPPPAAPP